MDKSVQEARQIVQRLAAIEKRTEPDRWRLAQLTYESGMTVRAWAEHVGLGKTAAHRYKQIWARWGVNVPQGDTRPTFTECWDIVRGDATQKPSGEVVKKVQPAPQPAPALAPPPPPPAPPPSRPAPNPEVLAEIVKIANSNPGAQHDERKRREALTPRSGGHMQWMSAKAELVRSKSHLSAFIAKTNNVTFPAEFVGFMLNDLKQLGEMIELAKAAVGGKAQIDWDNELTKLTEEETS